MPSTSAEPSSSPWGQARPTGASEADGGKRGWWGQARPVGAGEAGGGRRDRWGQARLVGAGRPMGAVSRRAKSLVNSTTPPVPTKKKFGTTPPTPTENEVSSTPPAPNGNEASMISEEPFYPMLKGTPKPNRPAAPTS